jgi:hypothetical protein
VSQNSPFAPARSPSPAPGITTVTLLPRSSSASALRSGTDSFILIDTIVRHAPRARLHDSARRLHSDKRRTKVR